MLRTAIDRARTARNTDESGFTLIELLIVIVILGVLAAIVVFSVSGITDKGLAASCKSTVSTVQTAEEANYAQNGAYDSLANLKANGFLHSVPTTVSVAVAAGPPASYTVTGINDTTNKVNCTGYNG